LVGARIAVANVIRLLAADGLAERGGVGEIARRTSYPVRKIEYVVRAPSIVPFGRARTAFIYAEADVKRIASELRCIDREREPKSTATRCESADCQLNVAVNQEQPN
jgi:hypothetical protein